VRTVIGGRRAWLAVHVLAATTACAQASGTPPPLVPDANYIDWRYTNSLVAPWTELNFHYGNDRAKATVQIASYNITDSGYRRLESNLGINQAYLVLAFPGVGGENGRLNLTVGGFTNRYGAAGRWDAGKYETYLFGRTHVAECDHFRKVVAGVDMQQRKRKARRAKGLGCQMQQHDRILATGKEQCRIGGLAGDFAQDMNRFRLQPIQMREGGRGRVPRARLLRVHGG